MHWLALLSPNQKVAGLILTWDLSWARVCVGSHQVSTQVHVWTGGCLSPSFLWRAAALWATLGAGQALIQTYIIRKRMDGWIERQVFHSNTSIKVFLLSPPQGYNVIRPAVVPVCRLSQSLTAQLYFLQLLCRTCESGSAWSFAKGAPGVINGLQQTSVSHFYMLSMWTQVLCFALLCFVLILPFFNILWQCQ